MKVISQGGGFSAIYNDLKYKNIPIDLQDEFYQLVKKLRRTITNMPMKYIGRSLNDDYSIFKYENTRLVKTSNIDIERLILDFGTFSIPVDYFEAFKVLGTFINGQDSILFKWAEFSVQASRNNLSIDRVISKVLKGPITTRNIAESKKLYEKIL